VFLQAQSLDPVALSVAREARLEVEVKLNEDLCDEARAILVMRATTVQ
jgi:predicted secreted protein